ncbi:DgyrCDS13390 [Dimorphilus gyrociliatus]|uniref:Protein FAM221A n=1 Tax=Dimorphilus gyrociliatus TaxID=2664684 RepID=A0A7I8WAI6_9ANNE|nr:DgyrCDS13390 [Dimorphilus gyrociliatus]
MEPKFPAEIIRVGAGAQQHVDAYLEYHRIVRDDDGGTPFSEADFERYKRRVGPMRIKNRIYLSWANSKGMECKQIGPETKCFCGHLYHQHQVDFRTLPSERPIQQPCEIRGCGCLTYTYCPTAMGGSHPKCTCKHSGEQHSTRKPFKCKQVSCKCFGYKSAYNCGCGEPMYNHSMQSESKEERIAKGKPIGQEVIYKAMGGLTGFSSLMDGYMRYDNTGIGALPEEVLNSPITMNDHPFLRGNLASVVAHRRANKMPIDEREIRELESQQRRPGESELDYYERRYQERQKQSKIYKGPKKPAISNERSNFSITGSSVKRR